MKIEDIIYKDIPHDVYHYPYKTGIRRSPKFEEKHLAEFAVNTGYICSHDCTYCSSRSMFYSQPCFKKLGLNPFDSGYTIVDPNVASLVMEDARNFTKRGLVLLCTASDPYAPEAQAHNLGRGCLKAILAEQDWRVRILTKNAAVANDFDVLEKYRDRVLLGLSTTSIPSLSKYSTITEPYASPIEERFEALSWASRLGIPTYGMFCPIFPGAMSEIHSLESLFDMILPNNPVEIFAEPINARGPALKRTALTLRKAGLHTFSYEVDAIRNRSAWRKYAVRLVQNLLDIAKRKYDPAKMRILLYASVFDDDSRNQIGSPEGVIWLEKGKASSIPESSQSHVSQVSNKLPRTERSMKRKEN